VENLKKSKSETKPIEEVKPGLGMVEKLASEKKEKAEKAVAERKEMGLPTPY